MLCNVCLRYICAIYAICHFGLIHAIRAVGAMCAVCVISTFTEIYAIQAFLLFVRFVQFIQILQYMQLFTLYNMCNLCNICNSSNLYICLIAICTIRCSLCNICMIKSLMKQIKNTLKKQHRWVPSRRSVTTESIINVYGRKHLTDDFALFNFTQKRRKDGSQSERAVTAHHYVK